MQWLAAQRNYSTLQTRFEGEMKMGFFVLCFYLIHVEILFSTCSLALTEDGKNLISFSSLLELFTCLSAEKMKEKETRKKNALDEK